ncbi:hypothetical protein BMS3Bbin12_00431 [bacterium BMS3Bbin12]|nr:hypothetical protein BMS3Abin12_01857 [bacterium BMS3Abin12]GBE47274.1 hypothetical protein BMS3Bbin12_00431 [bacterium BMS3Bbin12]GBE50665.1 hypothetical protein BMS3Bbin13_01607 [bacterium BMS3Bbin13]HDJ85597.1 hypothetical protein [Chromatiales bacterium]HDO34293.1 hypothetical protein [Chromatiales bacterium]
MNVRRVMLDVDKARGGPELVDIAEAIEGVAGVEGVNITTTEIDEETVGLQVTVEGDGIDYDALIDAIGHTGAAVHSTDEIVAGARIVERVPRTR